MSRQLLLASHRNDKASASLRHLLSCVAGIADRYLVEAARIAQDPAMASQRLLLTSTAQAIVEELSLAQKSILEHLEAQSDPKSAPGQVESTETPD